VTVSELRRSRTPWDLAAVGVGLTLLAAACGLDWAGATSDHSSAGSWIDFPFVLGAGFVGVAPWSRTASSHDFGHGNTHSSPVPALAAVGGMAAAAIAIFAELGLVADVSAVALLAILVLRLGLATRDHGTSLERSQQEAHTDPLTGLANRRRLMLDLEDLGERSAALAILDLDGFKSFNDTYGHVAGDGLLAYLGRKLDANRTSDGRAYRLGGDEFCVLSEVDSAREAIERAVAALSTTVRGIATTCSWGQVLMPEEADPGTDALQVADRRMYLMKATQPASADTQLRESLSAAMHARHPGFHDHAEKVSRLAAAVANELALDQETSTELIDAARLHEIGKLALPEEVLSKPGPLDEGEWDAIHTYPVLGCRMLAGVPALSGIAELVVTSQERWDGGGYPTGIAGAAIPIGARIITVCDAYDVMISGRSYQPPITHAEAIAELRVCSGSHFDAEVVAAFARLHIQDGREPVAKVLHEPRLRDAGFPGNLFS
jgi:two-component system cell cycle response regulator